MSLAANGAISKLPIIDLANAYIAIAGGWKDFEFAGKSH
jgi:hypothetical protein